MRWEKGTEKRTLLQQRAMNMAEERGRKNVQYSSRERKIVWMRDTFKRELFLQRKNDLYET